MRTQPRASIRQLRWPCLTGAALVPRENGLFQRAPLVLPCAPRRALVHAPRL